MRVIEFDRSDAADVHEFASQNAKAVALGHRKRELGAFREDREPWPRVQFCV